MWNFCLRLTEFHFANYFINIAKVIASRKTFQGMFDSITNCTPSKFYVKLIVF